MSTGWLGYDAARVQRLGRSLAAAADELAVLVGDAGEELDVGATVRSIVASLRSEWIPVLHRIATDTAMTSWTGAGTGVVAALPQPPTGDAQAVARWWDDLSFSQQHAVVVLTPAVIGNRDGVPAWARDGANRQLLAADLERLGASERAGTLSDADAAVLSNAQAADAALADGVEVVDPRTGASVARAVVHLRPSGPWRRRACGRRPR